MRLEVGAGDRPTPGFICHDARPLPGISIVADMWDLPEHVSPGSCVEVRATHLLEHFSHRDTGRVIELWRDLLKPGGHLYIEVPNGEWQVRAAASGSIDWAEFVRLCYGDQDYPGNAHLTSFSMPSLAGVLIDAGLTEVQVMDIGMVLVATAERPA